MNDRFSQMDTKFNRKLYKLVIMFIVIMIGSHSISNIDNIDSNGSIDRLTMRIVMLERMIKR